MRSFLPSVVRQYSKEIETKLQRWLKGLCRIRNAAGTLLAAFNKHKGHLSVDEQIEYSSAIIPTLNHLDQTIEDTQINLDTL